MTDPRTVLAVEGLDVERAGTRVLKGVTLRVRAGEALAVLGRNGAGKTTLAETVGGFLRASGGRIAVEGEDMTKASAASMARQGVALVPEGRQLFWNMTVRENLSLGAHSTKWKWRSPPAPAFERVWDLFPVLSELQDRRTYSLSGGEQQMVAIGRALMSNPRVLVLDEPSSGLSPQAVESVYGRLVHLQSMGFATLVIEQNVDAVLQLCSSVALLSFGEIVASGGAEEMIATAAFATALFGAPEDGEPERAPEEPDSGQMLARRAP